MSLRKLTGLAALLTIIIGALPAAVAAQIPDSLKKAGVDRPIRVGMFKGTGTTTRYWHSNIHTSHIQMANMLANPAGAGLGNDLVVPPGGFTFYSSGVGPVSSTNPAECSTNGCGPTPDQIAAFVGALDTLDVMILSCVVDFGSRVSNTTQRQRIADFWTTKGYIGIHAITDSYGTWAPLDTIHGVRFNNHPAEQNAMMRRDSVFQDDSSWNYLNRGLFLNGTDTSFTEEWFFYTTSSATIRSKLYLKPTTKLYEAPNFNFGTLPPAGDHPMSWYRELPTGGRFFYTALGHRSQNWTGGTGPRFVRRQIYNAILWAAKYDSLSKVVAVRSAKAPGPASEYSRLSVSPSQLSVTLLQNGAHTVEIMSVDGKRVAFENGAGPETSHTFNLRPGVYALAVGTNQGRSNRLVTIP